MAMSSRIPELDEDVLEQVDDVPLVVDDQHPGAIAHGRTLPGRAPVESDGDGRRRRITAGDDGALGDA